MSKQVLAFRYCHVRYMFIVSENYASRPMKYVSGYKATNLGISVPCTYYSFERSAAAWCLGYRLLVTSKIKGVSLLNSWIGYCEGFFNVIYFTNSWTVSLCVASDCWMTRLMLTHLCSKLPHPPLYDCGARHESRVSHIGLAPHKRSSWEDTGQGMYLLNRYFIFHGTRSTLEYQASSFLFITYICLESSWSQYHPDTKLKQNLQNHTHTTRNDYGLSHTCPIISR